MSVSPALFLLAAAGLSVAQTAPSPPAAAPVAAKPVKMKCISREVTGSLAQRIRECHTPDEWERLRTQTQEDASRVLDNHVTSCGAQTLGSC